MYKNLRIVNLTLISESGNVIEGYISDSDRFNSEFLSLIIAGKVDGLTEIMIDNLVLNPVAGEIKFLLDGRGIAQTENYEFYAKCLIEENDVTIGINVVISNKVKFVSCSNKEYESDKRTLNINMCELSIPYKSIIKNAYIEE